MVQGPRVWNLQAQTHETLKALTQTLRTFVVKQQRPVMKPHDPFPEEFFRDAWEKLLNTERGGEIWSLDKTRTNW